MITFIIIIINYYQSTGKYLAVAPYFNISNTNAQGLYAGHILVSSDRGTTWVQTSAPSTYWSSISSDSTGQRLAACGGGYIYT